MLHISRVLCAGTVCLIVSVLFPLLAPAAVLTVRQDGSGAYATITAAISDAADGDTIEVGPGTYRESITIDKSLRILSTSGAQATRIDGEGLRRMVRVVAGTSVARGFSFTGGFVSDSGGAIRVDSAALRLWDSIFEGNRAGHGGGAVYATGLNGLIGAFNCEFADNHAVLTGGAGYATANGRLMMTACTFVRNTTDGIAGALECTDGIMESFDCLFVENSGLAGALYFSRSLGSVQRTTLHRNSSPTGATVIIDDSPTTNVTRNIFSSDLSGSALQYFSGSGAHSCNIYWDNAAGTVVPPPLTVDERVADPLFCGAADGNYSLQFASPAAPSLSPCNLLIGAFAPSCGGVSTERRTWGAIKALYAH